MNPTTSKLATLMGSASLLTLTNALAAQAQQVAQAQVAQAQMAQAQEVPEQVLITGSLIHGTAAVGVPVTNLNVQDFRQTGALTTADLFRTVPVANVSPGAVATACAPITVLAPTRFSIVTGCFQSSVSFWPMMRASTSDGPPAGNGTTMRIGRLG